MNGMNAEWKEISRFSFHQKCNNAWYAARGKTVYHSIHVITFLWREGSFVSANEKNFRKQNLCKIATGLMHAAVSFAPLYSFIRVRFTHFGHIQFESVFSSSTPFSICFTSFFTIYWNEIVLPLNINGMYLSGSNFKCYAI